MQLTREVFGNIPGWAQAVFYLLAAIAVSFWVYGIVRRIRLWRQGRRDGAGVEWSLAVRRLFRDVLLTGARRCGFPPATLPEKSALDHAASALRLSRAELESRLASMGKRAGAPWGKDQKEAALAAMVALSRA